MRNRQLLPLAPMILIVSMWAVLIVSAAPAASAVATDRLTVDNTWSETTHPGRFPVDAHFSWLAGGTHDSNVSFWSEGVLATPGIKVMAENGVTTLLGDDVGVAITAGSADAALDWPHWFCPIDTTNASCGSLVVEFQVDDAYPLVTELIAW